MKRFGSFQTFSPAERREKSPLLYDPRSGFVIVFKWPYVDGIHTVINNLDDKHNVKLGEILLSESSTGFVSVHFALLDYFCAINNLLLDVVRHEYRLLEESGGVPRHLYETILTGEWMQKKTSPKS